MPRSTTIKVSAALHSRLARRAHQAGTTLAGALEQALDAAEAQEFWDAVRRQNAGVVTDEFSEVALHDDLDDDSDDALGRAGW